ncbi:hypothetical protein KSP40_PGU000594 [Platanthera guangdongensis]|uniref:Uncharacterized protein n=1 Tax=Platanthera guangdongensis TaxID=2320717 RepID=A0ABR2M4J3_9ASPA
MSCELFRVSSRRLSFSCELLVRRSTTEFFPPSTALISALFPSKCQFLPPPSTAIGESKAYYIRGEEIAEIMKNQYIFGQMRAHHSELDDVASKNEIVL